MASYPPRGFGGGEERGAPQSLPVGEPATHHHSRPSSSYSAHPYPSHQQHPALGPPLVAPSLPALVGEEEIYRCVRSWFMALNGSRLVLGIFGLISLTFPSWWIFMTGDLVPILCVIFVVEVIGALVGLNSASLEKPHMFITYELIILLLTIYYVFKTGANLYDKRRAVETIIIASLAAACAAQYFLAESLRKRLKRRQAKAKMASVDGNDGNGMGGRIGMGIGFDSIPLTSVTVASDLQQNAHMRH